MDEFILREVITKFELLFEFNFQNNKQTLP